MSGIAGSEPDQAAGRLPPWGAVAAVLLVVAVPVATWWLVGDLTDPELRRLQASGVTPYYTVRPFDIAPATERAVGEVAVVLVVAALVMLVLAWLTGHLHVGWWGVLGVLSLVGAGFGFMWRGLTAPAHPDCELCGPGLVVLMVVLMVPIGLGLVLLALQGARWLLAPGQPPTTRGSSTTTEGRSPTE